MCDQNHPHRCGPFVFFSVHGSLSFLLSLWQSEMSAFDRRVPWDTMSSPRPLASSIGTAALPALFSVPMSSSYAHSIFAPVSPSPFPPSMDIRDKEEMVYWELQYVAKVNQGYINNILHFPLVMGKGHPVHRALIQGLQFDQACPQKSQTQAP